MAQTDKSRECRGWGTEGGLGVGAREAAKTRKALGPLRKAGLPLSPPQLDALSQPRAEGGFPNRPRLGVSRFCLWGQGSVRLKGPGQGRGWWRRQVRERVQRPRQSPTEPPE